MAMHIANERFNALYDAHADAVFRYCLFRVTDREHALDLTQDAFLRFWDAVRAEGGGFPRSEKAFLFAIARNLVIDWYRKRRAVSLDAIMEEGIVREDELFESFGVEDIEVSAEGKHLLEKLSELEPMYREPVYLRFVEGFGPKEIAEALGETANVISVRINRGLKQLKEKGGYQ